MYNEDQEPRWNLIAHIREQLEAGTYETEGKLRIVAEKLSRRLSDDASSSS